MHIFLFSHSIFLFEGVFSKFERERATKGISEREIEHVCVSECERKIETADRHKEKDYSLNGIFL